MENKLTAVEAQLIPGNAIEPKFNAEQQENKEWLQVKPVLNVCSFVTDKNVGAYCKMEMVINSWLWNQRQKAASIMLLPLSNQLL